MSFFGKVGYIGLRAKFVMVVSLVIICSMVIISGYLIKRQNEIYRQELENRGGALVANLAYNAEYGVILESEAELEDLLKGVARSDEIIYAAIYAADGRVLAETGRRPYQNEVSPYSVLSDSGATNKASVRYYSSNSTEFIELGYPVRTKRQEISRENLGTVYGYTAFASNFDMEIIGEVRLALTLANLQHEISRSQTAAILMTLMVVLSAIIIMTAFVRIITQPIESLVNVTDQISKGDLNKTVDIVRRDEIGLLAESFNRMIESLKQSQDEIEEYNRTLEEKIIERTRELEDAQQQLIQSEKLAGIGQLAAGVAHELNNPLGGILGYAQFTLEKMDKKELEEVSVKDYESFKRYLKDIETQSRRCKSIVQNLLKFSRSSNKVEFQDTDIGQIIEETLTFVEHQFVMKQVTLKKELRQGLPTIQGNPGQLQQVFTNIVINGLHASAPGTEMVVSSRLLPPLGEFPGAIEISFTDNGSGISEENLNKIFEPFFTTKEVGQGTGLGLSVSYGIIKDHGGEIKVKSKLGAGTTFTVMIPLEKSRLPVDKTSIDKQ
jgi:signal transduction histidine kinase